MSFTADDHRFMSRALQLAERGAWTTTPNPRVGCVVVQDGAVIGEGWHLRAGEPHAEVHALAEAGERARGATVYVTLEPCPHHGRTPPCAEALVAAGVARVAIAMEDPNPVVSGTGIAHLRSAGIRVDTGLMDQAAGALNPGFVKRMVFGHPWVRIKTASSLDGRTALAGGESKWITGEPARADAHRLRARACAILTGIGTVAQDDPRLTARADGVTRQPLRVVVDSKLRISPQAQVLNGDAKTLVACAEPEAKKLIALERAGAEVVCLPTAAGRVDLGALLATLARRGVNEVMTEAGAALNGALVECGYADEWVLYLAPTVFGHSARALFELPPLADMQERIDLAISDVRAVGADLRITARFKPRGQE